MKTNTKSALKVMTIVGTRPELIKLSRIIPLLDEHTQHTLVHTGQNFSPELNEVFFNEMRIRKPDHIFSVAGSTPMNSIAKILESTDQVLESVMPDAVLVLGDTNSALSVIAAKRRKIPIFHLEAGNRSFDQRTPEEVNRKIVDHTSD
ncbi:MAG: UDP-N-acetylglucosamine 2-epimerase (non-hydrolyzing), partial [Actinobacteria bacterium]|nr:UDP-N-acetylglucosamine 2-epimerase (non-hydrolyzing) [Actinomycetota bacterium]